MTTTATTTTYCATQLRSGPCNLNAGHRGRHTAVAFYCDLCGKMRRGQPTPLRQQIALGEWEDVADACFMCMRGLTGEQ